MSLFPNYSQPTGTGRRLTGSQRYWELIGRDFKRFFILNLFTLLAFLPLASGIFIAILSSSVLILIPSCLVGGAIAGPALSCLYDAVFRSLRDAPGGYAENYRRAFKQDWKQSILPGMIHFLLLGFYAFMLMTFWWSAQPPSLGTIAVFAFGFLLLTMFFSLYWPQVALFEQSPRQRIQNCLLFLIRYFWKTLGCALLQILYWAAFVLFLPWTAILLPFLGIWFPLFTANFSIYHPLDEAFGIEGQIAQSFPEQAAFYEDDEAWVKRKQQEKK